jgi:hypothetical protein
MPNKLSNDAMSDTTEDDSSIERLHNHQLYLKELLNNKSLIDLTR